MSFDLYTRTVRIGGPELAPGCGYRDIVIHEVTESELQGLRTLQWLTAIVAFTVGLMLGFGWALYALSDIRS